MKLISDFTDWYDHMFDGKGQEFHRMADDRSMNKLKQFRLLEQEGYPTPRHGFINVAFNDPHATVVYYEDPFAHRGEGKRLAIAGDLMRDTPNAYCAEYFIPWPGSGTTSYRDLYIGTSYFHLEYESDDEWRSNVGNVRIKVINHEHMAKRRPFYDYPLVAIDMVITEDELGGEPRYVDLNTAPGIPKEVQAYMGASNIVDEIESYAIDLGNRHQIQVDF